MARFSDLPEGLLEEIMSWLPPESLRRFKLVQKSWYLLINALMNDPAFVARHDYNMKEKERTILASSCRFSYLFVGEVELEKSLEEEIFYDDDECRRYFLVLANGDHSDYDHIPCEDEQLRNLDCSLNDMCFKLESQCDGIISLSSHIDRTVCLLNPALREMKIIRCSNYGNLDYAPLGVGFGYDLRAKEYKVVAITILLLNEDVMDFLFKAEVYSLRTNSWREIEFGIEMQYSPSEVVYCNGVCYWYLRGWATKMFCFDFSDETFRDVALPVGLPPSEGSEVSELSVWKDSVVLFTSPARSQNSIVIDVWLLGLSDSWTKHARIEPCGGIINRPLGFWNNVELILEAERDELKSYRLGSETVSRLSQPLDWYCKDRFVIYHKSLVSVLRKEGRRSVVQV